MLNRRRSGLGSLIPGADLSEGAGSMLVPLVAIAVNPYQPRRTFAPEALEELAASIRQYGILQPLSVRPREGGYELIAGERRLQAARKAGLREVPVMVRECTDQQMLALALVENLQREDLNAMEAAHSYQQLIDDFGLTQMEIADHVGKSRSTVANTLRLLALPASMQQAVEEGAISEGHARALLAVDNQARRETLFAETVRKGLSVRALEALATQHPTAHAARKSHAAAPLADANLQAVQTILQTTLGTRVRFTSDSTAHRGAITIEYYSPEDLERILENLHAGE